MISGWVDLREHVAKHARPQGEPELTGTFKLRKVDLQAEGYDAGKVADPLFVRDDSAAAYLPLTHERLSALHSGELRV